MYSGTAALAMMTNFQQSQDTLYTLASDTGGKALLDYNDLTKGIIEAQHSVTNYYIIGYYTTNANLDGKFRRVKVTVNPTLNALVEAADPEQCLRLADHADECGARGESMGAADGLPVDDLEGRYGLSGAPAVSGCGGGTQYSSHGIQGSPQHCSVISGTST